MRPTKILIATVLLAGACAKTDSHPPFANDTCTMPPCGVNGYHGSGSPGATVDGGASDASDAATDGAARD